MRNLVLILLLLIFNASCTSPLKSDEPQFDVNYASLIQKDITELNSSNVQLKKSIYYQGKNESKIIENPVWDKELRPFIECNIQTPAFEKLYSTLKQVAGDSLTITYTAKTEKSEIRRLEIILIKNELEHVRAMLLKHNSYFTLHETMEYKSGKGYIINGTQKMMFAVETVYRIEAQIVKPS